MSMDLEPVGALATAGLVAKVVEGDAGKTAHGAHADGRCANCGTQLTGPYCHQCGQTAHVHRSLLHILEELAHGILHFDTKSWRTLPLLVARPGLLTRRCQRGVLLASLLSWNQDWKRRLFQRSEPPAYLAGRRQALHSLLSLWPSRRKRSRGPACRHPLPPGAIYNGVG